jgi:lysozyme family protein
MLGHEGGYVYDKDDPGGETNFGISKRWNPSVDIKALTKDSAVEIYRREYWERYNFEKLLSLGYSPDFIIKVFDLGINIGPAKAKSIAMTCDDDIGQLQTMAIAYYQSLVKRNPKLGRFLHGWIRRVMELPPTPAAQEGD